MGDERRDAAGPERVGVGDAARAVGVSVRTLHHWDELGVVSPSSRTAAGYREYSAADVARLRRAVRLRDLGIPLASLRELLDAPADVRRRVLADRASELAAERARIDEAASAAGRLLAATDSGLLLTDDEQREVFGPDWRPELAAEARRRWGDSPQWAEYSEHAASRTTDEWREVADAMRALDDELASALRSGADPAGAGAVALAERRRALLGRSFHCTPSMHVVLGRMLVDEPGMAEHYERLEPGLASWVRAAIDAAARTHGVDPASATWG